MTIEERKSSLIEYISHSSTCSLMETATGTCDCDVELTKKEMEKEINALISEVQAETRKEAQSEFRYKGIEAFDGQIKALTMLLDHYPTVSKEPTFDYAINETRKTIANIEVSKFHLIIEELGAEISRLKDILEPSKA